MARAPKPEAHDETPRYRANEKSFIGHAIVEAGSEVDYDHDAAGDGRGFIGHNLSPVNAAAQAVVDAQSQPHPDKTDGPKAKSTRSKADAAAAAPAVAAAPATPTGGPMGEADGDLA